MAIQTITRQDILKKISDLMNHLPDEKLALLWEQIDALQESALQESLSVDSEDESVRQQSTESEITEFTVATPDPSKRHKIRLPIRVVGSLPPVEMVIGEPDVAVTK